MKILVVFGSASDENVALPLVEMLSKNAEVEYVVISAHRDLEKLREKMTAWDGDAIVAGAGLAAALPGVVAAMTKLPVFGVPVASQFGGLDSLCSIAQMPPGVPVITAAPGQEKSIALFLKKYETEKKEGVHFIVSPDILAEVMPDIEKAKALGKEKSITVTFSAQKEEKALNVFFVSQAEDVRAEAFGIHIPFVSKKDIQDPATYLSVMGWMQKGGVWVGVNNTRNAVQAAARLFSATDILYRGSVKDVRGVSGKFPYIFEFSDRYSIFDWGAMPDQLSGKGESLAWFAAFFFDFLGAAQNWKNWKAPQRYAASPLLQKIMQKGVRHHALGLQGKFPTRRLAVQPVEVIHPGSLTKDGKLSWDYAAYQKRPVNALVPLEVIFRFGVPEGSSLLKRTNDPAYCKEIGLAAAPKPGDRFDLPVIEFSTKLENKDRYIPYREAKEIAGLSDDELKNLVDVTALIALRLKDCFSGIDVELWDGKFEFAFTDAGDFMLVDSIGPDELRLTMDGFHFSKEALRGFYRPTAWHDNLEKAKDMADQRGQKDWKKICIDELKSAPPHLPHETKEKAEMIYKSLARELSKKYTGETVFADAWDVSAVVAAFSQKRKEVA